MHDIIFVSSQVIKVLLDSRRRIVYPVLINERSCDRDCGAGGWGGAGEGARAPQYFKNYRELVRKSVLCPPPPTNIESLTVSPQSQSFSAVPVRLQLSNTVASYVIDSLAARVSL